MSSEDYEDSSPKKRIPKERETTPSIDSQDAEERQPLSSDSPALSSPYSTTRPESYNRSRQRTDYIDRSEPQYAARRNAYPQESGSSRDAEKNLNAPSRPNYGRSFVNRRNTVDGGPRGRDGNTRFSRSSSSDRPVDGGTRYDRTRDSDDSQRSFNRDTPRIRDGNYSRPFTQSSAAHSRDGREQRRPVRQRPTNITKALVRLLYASRAFSLKTIHAGRVSLNGSIVTNQNASVRLLQDEVRVDGMLLAHNPRSVYVVMNKPKKFAGSREQDSRNVMNLISRKFGWYLPGGPLAKSVSGIIILTNDPEQSDINQNVFALMDKEYWIKVNSVLTKKDLAKVETKVEALHEENAGKTKVEIAQKNSRNTWVSITLRRARTHDLTKILAASGLEILAMERRRIGSISVADLPPGSWRRMSEDEMHEVIHTSVSVESVEQKVEQQSEVVLEQGQTSVWQKLYQRWFKSM